MGTSSKIKTINSISIKLTKKKLLSKKIVKLKQKNL